MGAVRPGICFRLQPKLPAKNVLAGFGGSGLVRKRSLDRAGIGYFHYFFSDTLKRGLLELVSKIML